MLRTVSVPVSAKMLRRASEGKKSKIPNVRIGLGIKHMTPYEMLRREGAKFVLAEGKR